MLVRPRRGVQLRDPVTKRLLPEQGYEVRDDDTYWVRRVMDGDALVVTAPEPEEEPVQLVVEIEDDVAVEKVIAEKEKESKS